MKRVAVLFGGSFVWGFVVGRVIATRSRNGAAASRVRGQHGEASEEQHDDEVLVYDRSTIAPQPS